MHHERIEGGPFACPVRALGRRYVHIRVHDRRRRSMLCAFWDEVGKGHITDTQVRFTVKMAAKALKYPERGIPLNRVDTHSLRSGGACALKLSGRDDVEIRKMGRWAPRSTAFLEYIQEQLSTFSQGMSTGMSQIETFTNMEGMTTREDLCHLTIF